MRGSSNGIRLVAAWIVLLFLMACSGGDQDATDVMGIPEAGLPEFVAAAEGEERPTPITALNVLAGDMPEPTPTPTVVYPELTPDIMLEVTLPPRVSATVAPPAFTPTPDPVFANCRDDELRILELSGGGASMAAVREICRQAPVSEAYYAAVEAFTDCAERHLLAWLMVEPEARLADGADDYVTGTEPSDYRLLLLRELLYGARDSELEQFAARLCDPGPDADRLQVAHDWAVCMEGDPAAAAAVKERLFAALSLTDVRWVLLEESPPGPVIAVALLYADRLDFDPFEDLSLCEDTS